MEIDYRVDPVLTNEVLSPLYSAAWPNHNPAYDFASELSHALTVLGAYHGDTLIGFARVAWDGGIHAFLLEPTVHPDFQHRGIGRELVERAAEVARERGCDWFHVDFEPRLQPFYDACGFTHTPAGLIRLR